jgi:hypothetical protein
MAKVTKKTQTARVITSTPPSAVGSGEQLVAAAINNLVKKIDSIRIDGPQLQVDENKTEDTTPAQKAEAMYKAIVVSLRP